MLCRDPQRVERVMGRGRNRPVLFGAVVVAMLSLITVGKAESSSVPRLEKLPAAKAMASVFSRPSTGRVPASVVAAVTRLAKTAHVGRVRASKGRLLLSNLGPRHRSIYVFPTTKCEVCSDVTHLEEGCKKAFLVGEPASIDGSSLYFPSTSGPPAEIAGLTKDGVRRVQVVIHGTPHNAVFGRDAWYYRFPTNRIPATAATKLLVTLSDGSTKTIPMRLTKPPA
jgi:hypothetical protein